MSWERITLGSEPAFLKISGTRKLIPRLSLQISKTDLKKFILWSSTNFSLPILKDFVSLRWKSYPEASQKRRQSEAFLWRQDWLIMSYRSLTVVVCNKQQAYRIEKHYFTAANISRRSCSTLLRRNTFPTTNMRESAILFLELFGMYRNTSLRGGRRPFHAITCREGIRSIYRA